MNKVAGRFGYGGESIGGVGGVWETALPGPRWPTVWGVSNSIFGSHGCSRHSALRLRGFSVELSGSRPWLRDGQGRKAGEWWKVRY